MRLGGDTRTDRAPALPSRLPRAAESGRRDRPVLLRLLRKEIATTPTLEDGQGQYLVVVQLPAWRAGQGWLPCGQQILNRRATSRRYDRGMNLQLPELLIIGVFLVFLIFFVGGVVYVAVRLANRHRK
jgi:hypothetical protein